MTGEHSEGCVKRPQPQSSKPESEPPLSGTCVLFVQAVRGLDRSHSSPPNQKSRQPSCVWSMGGVLISSNAVGAALLGTQLNSSIVVPDLTSAKAISSPTPPWTA